MPPAQFISQKVLLSLQTIYQDIPARPQHSGDTPQAKSLKEFLDASGSDVELRTGEILFKQDDPGDGLFAGQSG